MKARPIERRENELVVPNIPLIPVIEGDGIGPQIWAATQRTVEAAVAATYAESRWIAWRPLLAGDAAIREAGVRLPEETVRALSEHVVAIKGPLTTTMGGGERSPNVRLREALQLYACIRPVRSLHGLIGPLQASDQIDIVVFRENSEDVFGGFEVSSNSPEAASLITFCEALGCHLRQDSAVGLKTISPLATRRLMRQAILYAQRHGRRHITVLSGSEMVDATEGAFWRWARDSAREEFHDCTVIIDHPWRKDDDPGLEIIPDDPNPTSITIDGFPTTHIFGRLLLHPRDFDIVVTPNLVGDYLSDYVAGIAGGPGLAPGVNLGDHNAIFEASHGSVPHLTGLDRANPTALMLSSAMMLEHIGWNEAAGRIRNAIANTIADRVVTYDFARILPGSRTVGTAGFADAVCDRI